MNGARHRSEPTSPRLKDRTTLAGALRADPRQEPPRGGRRRKRRERRGRAGGPSGQKEAEHSAQERKGGGKGKPKKEGEGGRKQGHGSREQEPGGREMREGIEREPERDSEWEKRQINHRAAEGGGENEKEKRMWSLGTLKGKPGAKGGPISHPGRRHQNRNK